MFLSAKEIDEDTGFQNLKKAINEAMETVQALGAQR